VHLLVIYTSVFVNYYMVYFILFYFIYFMYKMSCDLFIIHIMYAIESYGEYFVHKRSAANVLELSCFKKSL